jgi:hypothetical protein
MKIILRNRDLKGEEEIIVAEGAGGHLDAADREDPPQKTGQ